MSKPEASKDLPVLSEESEEETTLQAYSAAFYEQHQTDNKQHVALFRRSENQASPFEMTYVGPLGVLMRHIEEFNGLFMLLHDHHVDTPVDHLISIVVNAAFDSFVSGEPDIIAADGGESLIKQLTSTHTLVPNPFIHIPDISGFTLPADVDSVNDNANDTLNHLVPFPGRVVIAIYRVFDNRNLEEISAYMRPIREQQRLQMAMQKEAEAAQEGSNENGEQESNQNGVPEPNALEVIFMKKSPQGNVEQNQIEKGSASDSDEEKCESGSAGAGDQ